MRYGEGQVVRTRCPVARHGLCPTLWSTSVGLVARASPGPERRARLLAHEPLPVRAADMPARPAVRGAPRGCANDAAGHARADLERELLAVDREEAKLVKEIRAAAARGNEAAARTLAKSLVRQRGQKAKLHAGILQMRGVRSTLATTAATSSVGASMATATAAMQAVGAAADPQKTMAAVQQFSRENAHMDMARLARPASALQTRCRGCHAPVGGWTPVVSPACFSPVSHRKLSSEWKLVGAAHSLKMPWRRW